MLAISFGALVVMNVAQIYLARRGRA